MIDDVIKAPPRRVVLLQVAGAAALGLVVALARRPLFRWMGGHLTHMQLFTATALIPFGAGVMLLLQATRTLRSGQHPPPGTWVWRDTPVLRGRSAAMKGWVLAAGGLLLALCALAWALIPVRYGLHR